MGAGGFSFKESMELDSTTEVTGSETPAASTEPSVAAAPGGVTESPSQAGTPAPVEQAPTEAAAPVFTLPETDDDLKGQENNPHVQGLIQLRQELRTRNQAFDTLKPLEPWKPVVEKYTDPATVETGMSLYAGLNAPVIENGVEKIGVDGYVETTTRPFVEQLAATSPQTADKLAKDLFLMPDSTGNARFHSLFRQLGLDPAKIDLYRSGAYENNDDVTPELLAEFEIPPTRHDAFKRLTETVQGSFRYMEPAEKQKVLDESQEYIDNAAWRQQQDAVKAQEQQTQAQERAAQFEAKVEAGRGEIWQAAHQSLVTSLAKEVQLSSDPAQSEGLYAMAFSTLATALDPATRFVAEMACKAAGTQLDPAIPQLAESALQHRRAAIHFEQSRDLMRAGKAQRLEREASEQLYAKARPALLAVAKMLGANGQVLRQAGEQALAGAGARPVVGAGNGLGGQNGTRILPEGMRPGSPEAIRHIRAQTLGAQ